MERKITISVVMATYNGEKYIREQLDSIINQTMLPDELLISDDGSTDATLSIVAEYVKRFSFIRVRSNTEKHGPSGNFINAFRDSKGDVIFPCDQDDIWMSNKIATMLASFEDEVDIVAAQDEIREEESGEVCYSNWGFPDQKITMWGNHLAGHACAFRRKVIEVYDVESLHSFDYLLCLYGSITKRSKIIPDKLVIWRRHLESCTSEKPTEDSQIPLSKFGKFLYASRSCLRGGRTKSINDYMYDREKVLMRIGGGKTERLVLRNIRKQTLFNFVLAGILNMRLHLRDEEISNLRTFIARLMWAFCYPATFWVAVHREKWIT